MKKTLDHIAEGIKVSTEIRIIIIASAAVVYTQL